MYSDSFPGGRVTKWRISGSEVAGGCCCTDDKHSRKCLQVIKGSVVWVQMHRINTVESVCKLLINMFFRLQQDRMEGSVVWVQMRRINTVESVCKILINMFFRPTAGSYGGFNGLGTNAGAMK